MVHCEYCGRTGFTTGLKLHYNACTAKKYHEKKEVVQKTEQACKTQYEKEAKMREQIRQEERDKLEKEFKNRNPTIINYHIDNSVHTVNNIIINTQKQIKELDDDFNTFLENVKKMLPQMKIRGIPKDKIGPLLLESAKHDPDESTKRILNIIDNDEIEVEDNVNGEEILAKATENLDILAKEIDLAYDNL